MVQAQRAYINKILGQLRMMKVYVRGEALLEAQFLTKWNVDVVAAGRALTLEYLGYITEYLHAGGMTEEEAARIAQEITDLAPNMSQYSPRAWHYSTFHLSMVLAEVLRDVSFSKEDTRARLDQAFERADLKVFTIDDMAGMLGVDPD